MIEQLMSEPRFDYMKPQDKRFVVAMTNELLRLGYDFGGVIGDGICWGRYMLIFRKTGAKSPRVYARIYIREKSVALRYFLKNETAHSDFVLASPDFIRDVFVGDSGSCNHCRGDECRFRKTFDIGGARIEKCNGEVYTFTDAKVEMIPALSALFTEFNPPKKSRAPKS